MKKDTRIVYMGTPDFAVPALDKLVTDGYNVVGVVTMPDKAIGRHHEALQSSPVKKYAVAHNIPVLQPEKLKDDTFLEQLRSLQADLQIVVAFRMLPKVIWDMPQLGTFNLHAALLPQYRGAAPINWAIINGETETGLTTFFLDENIDTGRIIRQVRVPIHETDCAEDVHDRLMTLGADLVEETVDLIIQDKVDAIPQEQFASNGPLLPAPKIFHETCEIHWSELTCKRAYDFIRGLSPYPAAWTTLVSPEGKETMLKIYKAQRIESKSNIQQGTQGTIDSDGKTYLRVALCDGWIDLTEIQMSGKKRMLTTDFLRGIHINGYKFQ